MYQKLSNVKQNKREYSNVIGNHYSRMNAKNMRARPRTCRNVSSKQTREANGKSFHNYKLENDDKIHTHTEVQISSYGISPQSPIRPLNDIPK